MGSLLVNRCTVNEGFPFNTPIKLIQKCGLHADESLIQVGPDCKSLVTSMTPVWVREKVAGYIRDPLS